MKTSRMRWLMSAAIALWMGMSGCSDKGKPTELGDGAIEIGTQNSKKGFDLKWGEFSTHPARAALQHCHLVDSIDLNLLRYVVGDEPIDANEIASVFSEKVDPKADEFEKKRQWDAIDAKVAARLKILRSSPLCLRHEIVVGKYDFTAGGFRLQSDFLGILFEDFSVSGEAQVARLEQNTETRRPDGYKFPALLTLVRTPTHLSIPEAQAEALWAQLPQSEGSTADGNASARSIQDASLNSMQHRLKRMSSEALEATLLAEEFVPQTKEDWPIGEVFNALYENPQKLLTGRRVDVVVVFKPVSFQETRETLKKTRIAVKTTGGIINQLVAITPQREVFAVTPNFSSEARERQGQRQAPDAKQHRDVLEQTCGARPRTEVVTNFVKGELVDTHTPVCDRCPKGSRSSGRAMITNVLFGSFTHPGAVQALVTTTGCESMADGGDGLTLIEQAANGSWLHAHYTAGAYSEPEIVKDSTGRDLLVYQSTQSGGGEWSGAVMLGVVRPDRVTEESLFPISDNSGSCQRKYLVIKPHKITRKDLDGDGVLDLVFSVQFHQGTREGKDCDFGRKFGIGAGETLKLSYLVRDGALVLDEGSKETYAKILRASRGG